MSHEENAIEALAELREADLSGNNAWQVIEPLRLFAQVEATLALVDATKQHTQVISTFMASTMTPTQAKNLVKAIAGLQ